MQGIGTQASTGASVPRAEAFADWVTPHLTAMRHLAARLAAGAHDDVVQDALVRAWKRWETYDEAKGSPRTWLLAIVAGEARRGRFRARQFLYDLTSNASASDVDRDVDIQRAVQSLPRRMRLAVELHYFVGLSVIETAAVMGISEGTVKSTLHDARERLRPPLQIENERRGR